MANLQHIATPIESSTERLEKEVIHLRNVHEALMNYYRSGECVCVDASERSEKRCPYCKVTEALAKAEGK